MLRPLLVLLVAANLFWFAASHGWLPRSWLPFPDEEAQREPQRMAQQLRPEAITVLPDLPAAAAVPSTRTAAPTVCLQTAVLADDAAVDAALAMLQAAGIAPERAQRVEVDDGLRLRVDGVGAAQQEALRAAAALAAGGPAFSPCP
jgi:hypothetical protein